MGKQRARERTSSGDKFRPAADDMDASASGEMFFIMSVIIFIVAGSFIASIAFAMSGAPGGPALADAPPPPRAARPPGAAAAPMPGCILDAISIMRSISSGDIFLNMSLAVRAISGVIFCRDQAVTRHSERQPHT